MLVLRASCHIYPHLFTRACGPRIAPSSRKPNRISCVHAFFRVRRALSRFLVQRKRRPQKLDHTVYKRGRAHAFISRIATADRIFWSRENSDRARPNAEIEISARGTKSKVATREKSPTQLPRLVNAKRGRFKKRISRSNSSSWNNVTEAH